MCYLTFQLNHYIDGNVLNLNYNSRKISKKLIIICGRCVWVFEWKLSCGKRRGRVWLGGVAKIVDLPVLSENWGETARNFLPWPLLSIQKGRNPPNSLPNSNTPTNPNIEIQRNYFVVSWFINLCKSIFNWHVNLLKKVIYVSLEILSVIIICERNWRSIFQVTLQKFFSLFTIYTL